MRIQIQVLILLILSFATSVYGNQIVRTFETRIDTLHTSRDYRWQLSLKDTTLHIKGMKYLPDSEGKILQEVFFEEDVNSASVLPNGVPSDVVHYPFNSSNLYKVSLQYSSSNWNNDVTILHVSNLDTVIFDINRCPVHYEWMQPKDVEIEYGIGTTSWSGPAREEKKLFPFRTKASVGGGCIITKQTHVTLRVCSLCDDAFETWLDADCSEELYYGNIESFPSPIGGYEALFEECDHPLNSELKGKERVIVQVTVSCSGKVTDYQFLRGYLEKNSDIIQALLKSEWEPASIHQGRKAVTSRVSIPLPVEVKKSKLKSTVKN